MKSIGGFFGIEFDGGSGSYHPDALALTSGRACLSFILEKTSATKIYVPNYICNSALLPMLHRNVHYEFYGLNEDLSPRKNFQLGKHEYILYVNYFGLKTQVVDQLYQQYGNHLIIDNTQAFFEKNYQDCWSFNSARKFFGVPDGGYLYPSKPYKVSLERNTDIAYLHLIERAVNGGEAYAQFLQSEAKITTAILAMSALSEKILLTIDYAAAHKRRRENYTIYENAFSGLNKLKLSWSADAVPFAYPLLLDVPVPRDILNSQQIFIPTLWQDVLHREAQDYAFEQNLSQCLLPLPIDHRYSSDDCQRVIDAVCEAHLER